MLFKEKRIKDEYDQTVQGKNINSKFNLQNIFNKLNLKKVLYYYA